MRVGIVGFGGVGQDVATRLVGGAVNHLTLAGVTHTHPEVARQRLAQLDQTVPVLPLDELVEQCDVVVESATAQALPSIARTVLRAGRTLVIISAAGLLDIDDLDELTRAHGGSVVVASGMLPGLDLLRSAAEGSISSVRLTTRIRPESLVHEKHVTSQGLDLYPADASPVLVFTGSAEEAARAFPRHFNVAVALALGGIGLRRTQIEIWSDASVSGSRHRVQVVGDLVELDLICQGVPSAGNPRTSRLVGPSIITALRRLAEPVRIGS